MSQKELEARGAAAESDSRTATLPAYSPTSSDGPTAESPFDFPSAPPLDFATSSTTASSSSNTMLRRLLLPIAIPQITPEKTAPFLEAYAPPLLQYGITPESWRAFLTTMSAFLAAKVSQQALAHTTDIGRHVTKVPKRFGQGTVEHTKSVGNHIRDSAKSGNYVGAAMGVVGGAITLPVGTAFRAVGGILSLPGTAIGAALHKPLSPRERAAAYAVATNEKWLGARGLRAQLVDSEELAKITGKSIDSLLGSSHGSGNQTAASQLNSMKDYISKLETFQGSMLELGRSTLWLTVVQDQGEEKKGDRA